MRVWGCEGVGSRRMQVYSVWVPEGVGGGRGRYERVGADRVSKGSSSVNSL